MAGALDNTLKKIRMRTDEPNEKNKIDLIKYINNIFAIDADL